MFKKIAEEFDISVKKAKEMAIFIMDTIDKEVAEKGKLFVGRNHYFKVVKRAPRKFHNMQTKQIELTKGSTSIVYKQSIAAN